MLPRKGTAVLFYYENCLETRVSVMMERKAKEIREGKAAEEDDPTSELAVGYVRPTGG